MRDIYIEHVQIYIWIISTSMVYPMYSKTKRCISQSFFLDIQLNFSAVVDIGAFNNIYKYIRPR